MSHQAVGTQIHVLLDFEKQKAKTTLASGIIVPPEYEYMQYFLQYGPILSVGRKADPLCKVGRIAIFHHLIEEQDSYVLHRYENGDQIRFVDTRKDHTSLKLFAVVDEDQNLIPVDPFVICDPDSDETPEHLFEEFHDPVNGTFRVAAEKKGDLWVPVTGDPKKERHFYRPTVAYIHPDEEEFEFDEQIVVQDFGRYPIELDGQTIWACNKEFIVSKILKENQLEFSPITEQSYHGPAPSRLATPEEQEQMKDAQPNRLP